jgi:peroxiredoxin
MRPSSAAVFAIVALAGFTVWITRQAKVLEEDLQGNSRKIALLGKPAPDFRLPSLDGRTVSLSGYRGRKKLLLVFWASWNNGSHSEILLLDALYQRSHTAESDFDILGISLDDDRAAAQAFVNQSKTPFLVLLDPNRSVANTYQIRSVPTELLLDASGKVEFGTAGIAQRNQGAELMRRLGIRGGDFRMEMGAPNAGRGN